MVTMPIKFAKDLQGLSHFEDIIEEWIPPGREILDFYVIPAREDQIAQVYGNITTDPYDRSKKYRVGMYLHYYSTVRLKPLKRVLRAYSTLELLRTVAHEVSHLYDWLHTPHQQIIEAQILENFMLRLIDLGYVSEEQEMNRSRVHKKAAYSITRP